MCAAHNFGVASAGVVQCQREQFCAVVELLRLGQPGARVGHAQRGAHAHDNTVNWVLGGFGPDQRKQLPEFLADGADAAETIIFDGLAATQEKFNGR